MSRVGWFDSAIFDVHEAGLGHPESPARLAAVRRGLREARLDRELVACEPRPATHGELLRVHTPEHVHRIAATEGRYVQLDPDTAAGPRSYEAALLAAGAVVGAVERVLDGSLDRAFCAVRPPGHHATPDRAMGFCLFNNVAVGAAAALARGLERVAIVDFDVHHGNGTQDVFWSDPRVLYVSSHQMPLYPGTGSLDEVGARHGSGFNVNLPMPPGCGDAEYAAVYRDIVLPIARGFAPQLVLVSAGFDAAAADPLAGMELTAAGYRVIADVCMEVAEASAAGRLVVALEGGYDLGALSEGAASVVGRMLRRAPTVAVPPATSVGRGLVEAYRAAFAEHWPVLRG